MRCRAVSRRHFLKAAAVLSGIAAGGCGRSRPKIFSYVNEPEDTPGVATFYSSTCRECPAGCGTLLRVRENRPVKIEGNPDHPVNRGSLCARGQAGLYRLYDDKRFRGPLKRGAPIGWQQALRSVHETLTDVSSEGKRVLLFTGLEDLLVREAAESLFKEIPGRHVMGEPVNYETVKEGFFRVTGRREVPAFDLEGVDFILNFGAEIFETFLSPVEYGRVFGALRERGGSAVTIASRSSLTADTSDQAFVAEPGGELAAARAVLSLVAEAKGRSAGSWGLSLEEAARESGLSAAILRQIARALLKASSPFVFPGAALSGSAELAAVVFLINEYLGSMSRYRGPHAVAALASAEELEDVAARAERGEYGLLLCHGADPFSVPRLAKAFSKIKTIVSFDSHPNATTAAATYVLPADTPFETWGLYEPRPGLLSVVQPTREPLFDTRPLPVLLAGLAGKTFDPLGRVKTRMDRGDLRLGVKESSPRGVTRPEVKPRWDAFSGGGGAGRSKEGLHLSVYPSLLLYDGRAEGNPYLQEIPDPLNLVVWRTVAEIHPKAAGELGVTEGDWLEISSDHGTIRLKAKIQPRGAERVIGVALGRSGASNPWSLVPTAVFPAGLIPVSVKKVRDDRLPLVAGDTDQHERRIAREVGEREEGEHEIDPNLELYDEAKHPHYRWGMTIDLDRCTGCSACVAACMIENNIPIVGEKQVNYGREMQWISIQRYETERGMMSLPMLCQQCSKAPCEPVCPVYATHHSSEGLNVQTYNRCIGTRYCANNCPYKVRRFNWFDYTKPSPVKEMLNPDVTVRGVGVMEKCTFCIQRIRRVEIDANIERRPIHDGEVIPACAQTCPTEAIVFGNLKDENSRVRKVQRKAEEEGRAYKILEFLGIEPAVTYLKRRRNFEEEV
ncbi:MAG: 4Fe-4S dicluster domain-containing protein [Candidatus Hydrogenedentota bacterium]|nr:MAG: 4Fe-4S dicluster domain-containing protein [Candidatus Hydrogenedentota bacterium]